MTEGKGSTRTSAPVWGASTMTAWPPSVPTYSPTWSTSLSAAAEEHEVTRCERRAGWQPGAGVELVLGDPGQGDPRHLVGGLDQTGAVEADAGRLAAPDVRRPDLGQGPLDGDGLPGPPPRRSGAWRLPVALGEVEDLGDVASEWL